MRASVRSSLWLHGWLRVLAACLGGCGGGGAGGSGAAAQAPVAEPPSSTSPPPAVAAAQTAQTQVDPAIVAADNQLGLNVLGQLLGASSANVSLSPVSFALVLQILLNGAVGDTQTAMAGTLQLGSLTLDEVNSDNAALQASLEGLSSEVTLTLASSLWVHGGASAFQSAFVNINETYHGAALGNLAGPSGTLLGDPDTWVSTEADGLITSITPAPVSDIQFEVTNAIYFKGVWEYAFPVIATAGTPFTRADGSMVTAQMMMQSGQFSCLQGADVQAVSLPYAKGRSSMLIVPPAAGEDLATWLAGFSAAELESVVAAQTLQSGGSACRASPSPSRARWCRPLAPWA